MKSVFVAFVLTACLMLTASGVVGGLITGPRYFDYHFALGLVTTFFACLGHTVVLTYFMATGKMIKLAVEDAALDVELFQQARALKRRAFRAVIGGIIMLIGAALAGGWVTYRPEWSELHLGLALVASGAQLAAWWVEYAAISANGRLMDEVFRRHAGKSPPGHPA